MVMVEMWAPCRDSGKLDGQSTVCLPVTQRCGSLAAAAALVGAAGGCSADLATAGSAAAAAADAEASAPCCFFAAVSQTPHAAGLQAPTL